MKLRTKSCYFFEGVTSRRLDSVLVYKRDVAVLVQNPYVKMYIFLYTRFEHLRKE